ncbi:hypothetical protein [Pedobacter heparinus]|uniref:hypothetical protein n=1 Tax=Pedobacter heparinus TaxID=984 RepID=UPI00293074A1|nr:hypothetical protein [Pedobacter heparinus]
MNKLLLIAFMAVAVIGCKKDSSQVVKMNNTLMGKWSVLSNKIVYYDQSGQKEYEEVLDNTSIAAEITFTKDLKASLVSRSGEVLNTRYNLVEESNIIYLELFDAAIFDANVWTIAEASAKDMTWTGNFSNIKYEDKDTGEIIEAPKAILTLKFNKQ